MTAAFVKTFKRVDLLENDIKDAPTIIRSLEYCVERGVIVGETLDQLKPLAAVSV